MEGHGWGRVYGRIKAFCFLPFPFPHQGKFCPEGLQGRHAFSMPGRTLTYMKLLRFCAKSATAHIYLDSSVVCACESIKL